LIVAPLQKIRFHANAGVGRPRSAAGPGAFSAGRARQTLLQSFQACNEEKVPALTQTRELPHATFPTNNVAMHSSRGGLSAGHTCEFRAVAKSATGMAFGREMKFEPGK